MTATPKHIHIHKMHGSGNDFVLIDNRELGVPVASMEAWAQKICPTGFGVGADGLIFLEMPEQTHGDVAYRWHFYNADGSRAEMCGNASRCVAKLAKELGMASSKHAFMSDAGAIKAEILETTPHKDVVKVQLTEPVDQKLNITLAMEGVDHQAHFVNTGVPHAVILFDDVAPVDVKKMGALVRYHDYFAPQGTNANFAQVKDRKHVLLRTYERGVEGETFACGTGAAATVLITHALGLTDADVEVTTSGGEQLGISLEDGAVYLSGKAVKVYSGELLVDALEL